MKNYGIRDRNTGKIIETYKTAEEAASHITDESQQEVAERSIENVYETFPDGKTYITGIQEQWKSIPM